MIVNVAEVAPTGTVTDAGSVSAVAELARVTAVPPLGATFESVTVHVVFVFWFSALAVHRSEEISTGASSDTDVFTEDPLMLAVIVAA